MRFLTGSFVLLLCATPLAQPQGPRLVRAARWLDVTAGQMRSPAVIVVQDGKIASVGGEVPAGAQTLDLGDVTLLPELIDVHTHLTADIEGHWVIRAVRELPADAALRVARNAKRTLEAGFTTVRDVGAPGFADVALMKAIDAGMVPGPRMFPAAHALSITGGHCDETGWAPGILERVPMTPLDAIRTATLNAADLLGLSDRGSIAPGRFADLIAVSGDRSKTSGRWNAFPS